MREDFRIIVKKNGLELNEVSKVERKKVIIDKQILWRIVENIISNSVRFANSKIDIIFEKFRDFPQDFLQKAQLS